MMHIGPGDGKRPPLGKAAGPRNDQADGEIKANGTAELRLRAPGQAGTGFGVRAVGQRWKRFEINRFANEEPVGVAVVDLSDEIELVVFVSARRKRGES